MKKSVFENDLEISHFVPWHDSSKWETGKHYPIPHSDGASFDGHDLWLVGVSWGVYKLDPRHKKNDPLFGDIVPVVHGVHMKDACMIANALNGV